MKKAFILDISAFLHRGYYAFPDLKASDGTPTGAVYFFMTKFIDILQNFGRPDYIIAAIDSKEKPLFRKDIYPEYKSGRPQKHEDLKTQIEIFKSLAKYLNIQYIEKAGYEADDVMGYCTKYFSKENVESYMFTTDKDMAQLCVDDLVKQVILLTAAKSSGKGMNKYKVVDKYNVKEFLGVEASQVPDLFGLIGDKADAIPGVKGIGEVGGAKLIEEYQFLENIYENIENIKGATKKKLLENKENAFLSRELATIKTDFTIDESMRKWDGFDFLNLQTLLTKMDMYKTMTLFDLTLENLKDNQTNEAYRIIYKENTSKIFVSDFYFSEEWKITTYKFDKYEQYKNLDKEDFSNDNVVFRTSSNNLINGINIFLKEMGINHKLYKMPFIYYDYSFGKAMNEIERTGLQLIIYKI